MTTHIRSSSRSRFLTVTNSANPAIPASHLSESGPRRGEPSSSAKPSLLHRSYSTTARSLHATRSSVPGTSENSSSQRPTSSPSPPLSSLHIGSTNLPPSIAAHPSSPFGASSAHSRSALGRRQPASRSSHGIATSNGPPPALITQRSYTTEVARRRPAPPDLIPNRPSLRGRSHTDSWIDTKAQRRALSVDDRTRLGPWDGPGVGTMEAENTTDRMDSVAASHQSLDDDTDRTLLGFRSDEPSPTLRLSGEPTPPNENFRYSQQDKHPEPTEEDQQSKSSQEDLFLDLAKSDTMADDAANGSSRSDSRSERRRVSSASSYFST